tara:strand:- start:4228 stop:4935 length:708 start_codon:yes stop_codon:yes gene_type:complete
MANTQITVPVFTTLEVLSSADQNLTAGTGCPVFATTVTRDAAFGGAGEKVLAEGQICYLESTNVVQLYDGAAWQTVGPAPAVSSGLVLISAVTTNAATVTATNCFSGTYKNYLVVADGIVGCTNGFALEIRFGVSGTPTATGYKTGSFAGAPTTTGYISYNSADPEPSAFAMNIFAPNVAAKTVYNFSGYSMYEERQVLLGGNQTSANQFTDFVLTAGGGAFTSGTMRVYGYSNS